MIWWQTIIIWKNIFHVFSASYVSTGGKLFVNSGLEYRGSFSVAFLSLFLAYTRLTHTTKKANDRNTNAVAFFVVGRAHHWTPCSLLPSIIYISSDTWKLIMLDRSIWSLFSMTLNDRKIHDCSPCIWSFFAAVQRMCSIASGIGDQAFVWYCNVTHQLRWSSGLRIISSPRSSRLSGLNYTIGWI
jgi:hypothetical protein